MSKIHQKIFVVIVFLTLIVLFGIFAKSLVDTKTPINMKTSTDMRKPDPEIQITGFGGFFIEFEDGTTEPEVKAILENYNMTMNYTIDYNSDIMPKRYYLIVDKDKRMNVKDELRMEENWTTPAPDFPERWKGNHYIITVPEQIIHDENFQIILKKNDLELKKSVLCYIRFVDGFKNGIQKEEALRIEKELGTNENILIATSEGRVGGFCIEFENGTTEHEVRSILGNYNMTVNYTIGYNSDSIDPNHYIKVDKDKMMNVRSELGKVENWNESESMTKKENYYIIKVSEQFLDDEIFDATLEKNDLQLKKSVWCYINFENSLIWSRYAIGIKRELEMNERIMTVIPEYNI